MRRTFTSLTKKKQAALSALLVVLSATSAQCQRASHKNCYRHQYGRAQCARRYYSPKAARQTLIADLSLGESRMFFNEELKISAIRDRLFAYTEVEVGSQGPKAWQAFMETIFNRASARQQTLRQTLSGPYFPAITHARARRGASDKTRAKYSDMLIDVIGGSNISGFATGNASGAVGFGGGPTTFRAGGEEFGIERADIVWTREQRSQAASARVNRFKEIASLLDRA
jgi:hypothetical protein